MGGGKRAEGSDARRVDWHRGGDHQIDEHDQEKQNGQHQLNALNGLQLFQLIGLEVEVQTGRRDTGRAVRRFAPG
jgi:hypothetical protein